MTRTGEAARPTTVEDHTENFIDWSRDHARDLSFGALAILTIAAAAWLYGYSSRRNMVRAELMLNQAETSLSAQRLPEAQTQLQRLVQNYEGTPAAGQGLLRLGQVLFDQGKFAEGVSELEQAFGEYEDGPFAASVRQLAGSRAATAAGSSTASTASAASRRGGSDGASSPPPPQATAPASSARAAVRPARRRATAR